MHAVIITPYPFKGTILTNALKRENVISITFSPNSTDETRLFETNAIIFPHQMSKATWLKLLPYLLNINKNIPLLLLEKLQNNILIEKKMKIILDKMIFLDESIPLSYTPQLIKEIMDQNMSKKPKKIILKVKDFTLDPIKRQIKYKKNNITLRKKEYFLLELLMSNAGQVTTRERIIDYVWDKRSYITQNTIDVYIHRLRKKICPSKLRNPIKTIPCLGYVFSKK